MILSDHSTGALRFLQIHLGGDRNFCYLLGDAESGRAAAVDPGFAPERLPELASEHGLRIEHVLITHGHGDHVGGLPRLLELTGAMAHAGPEERVAGAQSLRDQDQLLLGGRVVRALHTPGHSPGHFCFLCEGRLITGDLLFCGKVGGTGPFFAGSSAEAEWESLHRILALPEETLVFPGHDYYGGRGRRPHSTIGHERRHNPFLLCPDLQAFCDLKENWAAYKEEHGIR